MSTPAFELQMVRENAVRAISQAIKAQQLPDATVSIVAGGARGNDRNTLIADVQAAHGRNPWYLGADALDGIRFVLRRTTRDTFDQQLKRIGRFALDGILENVAHQANKGGKPFRALTEAYAKYKARKHGFVVPILKATNDLLGGLRVVISRR